MSDLIMDRYRTRPMVREEIRENWKAWLRLKAMAFGYESDDEEHADGEAS